MVLLLAALFMSLALISQACGGSGKGGDTGTPEATEGTAPATEETGTAVATGTEEAELFVDPNAPVVNVDLGEWFITPDVEEIEAGPVTFNTTNSGSIPHELVIIKTDMPVNDLPVEDGRVDEDAAGEEIGEIEQFDAGLTVAGTFELEPGNYALICNIPGHYEAGMFVAFVVE
jgi:uncharacterized cupredoxin-like copper-binding protein